VPAEDWDAALAGAGSTDAYFRRAYVEASALLEDDGEPLLLEHEGAAFPVIVRGGRDVTSPAGYGGPVGAGDGFGDAYDAWCRGRGIVSTFVRFHPLLRNERAWPFHREPVAGSVSWRLEGDLLAGLHRHHRRLVRKAEAAGAQAAVREAPHDLGEFAALYDETMRRADASGFYFFPEGYWEALRTVPLVLAEVRLDGELAAAALCLATQPWLHYHLGASSEEGRRVGASQLAMLTAARWGVERGYEQFHLGAGLGGGGGPLLEWKQRFAPGPLLEQWVGKAVHDEERYRELAGEVSFEGFFPAYRRG
jgi:hypothetical protein